MLRDISAFPDRDSQNDIAFRYENMTPVQDVADNDLLDDIFGSDTEGQDEHGARHAEINANQTTQPRVLDQMDISRLRSTHVTNGYREGLSESKSKFVQDGFDEGYSLGAVLGFKAAWALSVIEGLNRAADSRELATGHSDGANDHLIKEKRAGQLRFARKELSITGLLSPDYFDNEGIWTYPVSEQDAESQTTFEHVSDAHPMIVKWTATATALATELGLDIQRDSRDNDVRSLDEKD